MFYHNTRGGFFSSPDDALRKNVDNPNADLFSILDQLEDYRTGGLFHFKLCYPEKVSFGDGCNEWKQTSNPALEPTITGFQPIALSFRRNGHQENWVGLGRDVSGSILTLIDDTPFRTNWFTAIGASSLWRSGSPPQIPGPIPLPVSIVELSVKVKSEGNCFSVAS